MDAHTAPHYTPLISASYIACRLESLGSRQFLESLGVTLTASHLASPQSQTCGLYFDRSLELRALSWSLPQVMCTQGCQAVKMIGTM